MTDFIIKTLGCKVNQCESSMLQNQLIKHGYKLAAGDKADVCVINTCTVTKNSDKKSLRLVRKLVRENNHSFVVVMGCVVDSAYEDVMDIEGVDVALGNKEKDKALDIILKNVMPDTTDQSFIPVSKNKRTRKFVKIQDGCESFCTYCIIPYVRGKETSRKVADIISEVTEVASEGFKEIVLTGIHLGRFNKGATPTLSDLINDITLVEGIGSIRLSSIELNEVTDDLLALIKKSDKVCPSLHIPLQHGSSRILALMERPYDAEAFLKRIAEIKDFLGGEVSFSTDIIVGFPGETEEDVDKMIDVLQKVGFHRVHTFPFSPREGTKAFSFEDQIDGNVVQARLAKIKKVTDALQREHYSNIVGQKRKVLLEIRDEKGFFCGYTDYYERIKIADISKSLEKNTFIDVYIDKAYDDFCIGTLIN